MAFAARFFQAVMLFALTGLTSIYAEQDLTLERAVQLALKRDALTAAHQSRHDAFKNLSVSEDTLPDPKIKLGMMNLPVDSFSKNQEPMTQMQIGIQQMIPRGDTLGIKSQRAASMASGEIARTDNQRRKVILETRQAWLEYFYWLNADKVVMKHKTLFKKLVSVTKQQYAAGRQKQQDVIRAELEYGMLEDREINIKTRLTLAEENLAKYIGHDFSAANISTRLPVLKVNRDDQSWIEQHPVMRIEHSNVEAGEHNVSLAKQSYKPSWMLDITYGKRENAINGAERADFVSAMVMFDVPLFTGSRQDKKVAASKSRLNSALNMREEKKRKLELMWQSARAKDERLLQRVTRYQGSLVAKARENTRAAMFSYQSGRGSFTALMRAQITELETQLMASRLNVEHKKNQAQLLYFTGENTDSTVSVKGEFK